jgi:hypothetical protein
MPFLTSDVLLGLLAGFSSRWVLRRFRGAVRIVSALGLVTGGLALTGLAAGWRLGIGPLTFGLPAVDWQKPSRKPRFLIALQ